MCRILAIDLVKTMDSEAENPEMADDSDGGKRRNTGGNFEEKQGGGFMPYSLGPIRVGVCKGTWIAVSAIMYLSTVFWAMYLVFQLSALLRGNQSLGGKWLVHPLVLGSELGLLATVAFMTFLVPAMIMAWITALVFQYLFGRGLFGRRMGLVQEGCQIAKDMTWITLKISVKKGNMAAMIVFVLALSASGFHRENLSWGTGKSPI